MANVDIAVGGRNYSVACRDGEEPHLKTLAAIVDGKARQAAATLGNMGESRHLLFAALLLADQMIDDGDADSSPAAPDPMVADALERLADRVEALAVRLEETGTNA